MFIVGSLFYDYWIVELCQRVGMSIEAVEDLSYLLVGCDASGNER